MNNNVTPLIDRIIAGAMIIGAMIAVIVLLAI